MKKTVEVTVCNICQEVGRAAEPWTVKGRGQEVRIDLCEEDLETVTLSRVLTAGEDVTPPPSARRRTRKVMTVQEAEKLARKASR